MNHAQPAHSHDLHRGHMGARQTIAAVGIATAIAALGSAAVYAATETPTMGHGGPPDHGGPPPWQAASAHEKDSAATVHAESVLSDGHGGYTTALTQLGTITALSDTSVTVRSADGFNQTYSLTLMPAAARQPFAVGDQVQVRATRSGQTPTVTSITGGQPFP